MDQVFVIESTKDCSLRADGKDFNIKKEKKYIVGRDVPIIAMHVWRSLSHITITTKEIKIDTQVDPDPKPKDPTKHDAGVVSNEKDKDKEGK
jgi:hypothetical protein